MGPDVLGFTSISKCVNVNFYFCRVFSRLLPNGDSISTAGGLQGLSLCLLRDQSVNVKYDLLVLHLSFTGHRSLNNGVHRYPTFGHETGPYLHSVIFLLVSFVRQLPTG